MHSRFMRYAVVLVLVLGGSAHAQLSFNLPKVTGLNAYYDPAVLWLPGGVHTERRLAYSFGVEASFTVARTSLPSYETQIKCRTLDKGVLAAPGDSSSNRYLGVTSSGEECRICYVEQDKTTGTDAWGQTCDVNADAPSHSSTPPYYSLDIAVGYGQTGTYGSAPFFGMNVDGQNLLATGLMRTAPSLSLNLNRGVLYGGVSVGLITLSAQTFLPPFTTSSGIVTPNLVISGITLAPSLRAGVSYQNLYAEIGYELRHFNAVEYRISPSSAQIPPTVPLSLTFHSAFLRVGTWWKLQD